jgi:hypothetical protein
MISSETIASNYANLVARTMANFYLHNKWPACITFCVHVKIEDMIRET